jgi:hypothetical protein
VAAAIAAIVRACDKKPELAARVGMLGADLDEGKALSAALLGADDAQIQAKGARKDQTFDRGAVQLRVESAVNAIAARGRMAFRADARLRSRFEALVAAPDRSKAPEPVNA